MTSIVISVVLLGAFTFCDRCIQRYGSRECLWWAIFYGNLAIIGAVTGHLADAIANGILAAWWAHLAWKRRKPRQRKPSKVAGRVRNLGHLLVVTPA